jgi:hypothetical protein
MIGSESPSKRAFDLIERWRECSVDIHFDVTFRDTDREAAIELDAELRKGEELAKAATALDEAYTSPSAGNNDRERAWSEFRRALIAYRTLSSAGKEK